MFAACQVHALLRLSRLSAAEQDRRKADLGSQRPRLRNFSSCRRFRATARPKYCGVAVARSRGMPLALSNAASV